MGHFIIIAVLALSTIPHITPAVLPQPNPMGALLQNMLNPANSDKARQILQLTGVSNKKPTSPVLNLLQELSVQRPNQVLTQFPRQVLPVQQVNEVIQVSPSALPCGNKVPIVQERIYPYPTSASFVQEKVYPYPAPAALVNPFLPAASPVSALAPPTSSLLPPVDPTQVRSHFLRKIPIPPPSL